MFRSSQIPRRYVLAGPSRKLGILQRLQESKTSIEGVISPKNEVTLPPHIKKAAGIPLDATHFAFIYPLKMFKRNMHKINISQEPWAFALLLGGFAYFGAEGQLLAVNALTIVPSPAVLHIVGPYTANQSAALAMSRLGRMNPVSITGLLDAGFLRFAWVHPGEKPAGKDVSSAVDNPHGGFMYEMLDGSQRLFVLTGGEKPDPEAYDHDGLFGHAYVSLRQQLVEAGEQRKVIEERRDANRQFRWDLFNLLLWWSGYQTITVLFFWLTD